MTRIYAWTEDEDQIAPDAVTVGIRSDTRILTIGGLQFGQRDALLYWPDWGAETGFLSAGIEGPLPVSDALERAETLRSVHAFKRVVVWLQHRELWDRRWGELAPAPGL